MVICLTGPPLTALVALLFALLLASATHSHPDAGEPHSSPQHPPLRNPRAPPPLPPPPITHSPPSPPHRSRKHGPTPPLPSLRKARGLNLGKKVGLSFAGIAVIVQFGAAGFLVYKKKQLFRVQD